MLHDAEKSNSTAMTTPIKRVIGRPFVKGEVANPGGRPKGLASYVRDATGDGKRAVDIAIAIMLGDTTVTQDKHMRISPELQLDAVKWLVDRGWGKAVNPIEITGLDGGPIQRLDLTVLAATDLEHLEAILSRSAAAMHGGTANDPNITPNEPQT